MAELFKPEVRDIGATNVSAYTPPSVDYSGAISNFGQIFKAVTEEPEVKAPSEAERKAEALRNVSTNMLKVDQIEDPTRKAVAFKSLQQNSYREYPMYVDDLNKFFGEVSGDVFPATGMSLEDIQKDNRLKWAKETAEGQLAVSEAMMAAPGNVEQQQLMIDSAYYQKQKFDSDMNALKAEAQGKKDIFEIKARPMIQGRVDEEYQKMFTKNNIDAILKSGESPSLALIDAVKAQRAFVLGGITSDINKNGLDPTTVKPENFMTQYDALISMLEANSTVIDRDFKNKTNVDWAKRFADAPFLVQGWAAGKVDPAMFTFALTSGIVNKEDFVKLLETGTGPAAINGTMPDSMAPSLSDGSPTDSPSNFASRYENTFSRESLIKTFEAKPSWKPIVDVGLKTVQDFSLTGESPEYMEAAHRSLTSMFMVSLPEIDTGHESMKPINIKKLLSDKTFMIADSMSKSMPDKGMGLYNAINTYSTTAASILMIKFNNQMETIKDTDQFPFKLQMDESGNVELTIDPVAVKTDFTLKKAMGAYRFATQSVGKRAEALAVAQEPTITDPRQILSNYVSLMEMGNPSQILDIVDALGVLARTNKKIPDSVKQGRDVATILKMGMK